jgi:hypothetical protein
MTDMDNDTVPEMFVGTHSGHILTYRLDNETWTRIRGPWEGIVVGRDTVVSCADLDGDGDNDCVVGEENGNVNYFENTGSNTVPVLVQKHGEVDQNPFYHIDIGDNSHPAFIDANDDGLQDLLIGSKDGKIRVYLNDGSRLVPDFSDYNILVDPYSDEAFLGYFTKPVTVDIDQNGLDDFIVTAEEKDPSAVVLDGLEYSTIGAVSVLSLITLSGTIFMCRNTKKTAPLVTAAFDAERQSLTARRQARRVPRMEPVLGGGSKTSGKLTFGSLRRSRNYT